MLVLGSCLVTFSRKHWDDVEMECARPGSGQRDPRACLYFQTIEAGQ